MVRIRKDILNAIVNATGYSERHVRRIIDKIIEASGYTIPNKRIGANILASKLRIKINQILDPDELAEVRKYLSEPVIGSIQIRVKGDKNNKRKTIEIDKGKSKEEKIGQLVEENRKLQQKIERLKVTIEKLDPRTSLQKLSLPQLFKNRIDKAYSRIEQGSYSEAIINCYLLSEILVKNLFDFLYPDLKNKRIKHEDKLKKIWNDEKTEKYRYPGIRVIASLLAVILWYRNKMGAHTEMTPTKEAARICIASLIQALIEFNRLGIEIGS